MTVDDHAGLFVPAWFVREDVNDVDLVISNILLGFGMATAVFTAAKGAHQTLGTWNRSHRVTFYIYMIWLEWAASVSLAAISWAYIMDFIPASVWYFLAIVFLWSLEVQFLLQIILNRLALLITVRGRAKQMQLAVGFGITLINISVFVIWVPARLQINTTFPAINDVWDRTEKVIFAIIDGSLNIYFIYLTRSRLINNGLTKYNRLFKFNLGMIFVSLSLDVILIGLMSLQSSLIYLQFHPISYLIKLLIEMNMADLIIKVVSATNHTASLKRTKKSMAGSPKATVSNALSRIQSAMSGPLKHSSRHKKCSSCVTDDVELGGIKRTTETHVVFTEMIGDDSSGSARNSKSSSIRELTDPFE